MVRVRVVLWIGHGGVRTQPTLALAVTLRQSIDGFRPGAFGGCDERRRELQAGWPRRSAERAARRCRAVSWHSSLTLQRMRE